MTEGSFKTVIHTVTYFYHDFFSYLGFRFKMYVTCFDVAVGEKELNGGNLGFYGQFACPLCLTKERLLC